MLTKESAAPLLILQDITMTIIDKFRMLAWLILGCLLYTASHLVGQDLPQLQTILYKLGHVTTLAWVGYWISRNALGRIDLTTCSTQYLARAILIAGVVIAGSIGL